MDKILIIVRGLPGSGKTTFARMLVEPGCICSADDYHMKEGKYDWKLENAGLAHKKCQEKCERLMKMNFSKIAIANTSTTEDELKPYYNLAKTYKYKVFSIIIENRHNGKNEHNVPEETINKMHQRFSTKLI